MINTKTQNTISSRDVAIAAVAGVTGYPAQPPYLPSSEYPEIAGRVKTSAAENITYSLFREVLRSLGLDSKRYNTKDWNPFGELIKPGQKVLIKPNMVRHIHLSGGDINSVITHGSLIRCVLDYVAIALKGDGEITVGDAPVQSSDFRKLTELNGLDLIKIDFENTWRLPLRIIDFRLRSIELSEHRKFLGGASLDGDEKGYCRVDLGSQSLLTPLDWSSDRYRVTSYACEEMSKHHGGGTHEYLIPRTVLEADVIINLPKLKTHRKAGLTAALKNLVGVNGHKDWLPHHRAGSVKEGGDEYLHPSVLKKTCTLLVESIDRNAGSGLNSLRRTAVRTAFWLDKRVSADQYLEGSWYGNDTLWRTVLDLNRLLIYSDRNGKISDKPQRACISIVDGIIAGEGEGPMEPESKMCGVIAAGKNPAAVDIVLATLAGFDYKKIPVIANSFMDMGFPLTSFEPDDVIVHTENKMFSGLRPGKPFTAFSLKPASGWVGHIEAGPGRDGEV